MAGTKGKGWHGDNKRHSDVQKKGANKDALRQPMKKQASGKISKTAHTNLTEKLKKEFSRYLTRLGKENSFDTTIPEFKRWLNEDLMPFEQKPVFEQVAEKIDYEIDLGNESSVFKDIEAWLDLWLEENTTDEDEFIFYHGTTESKYQSILRDGELKISTPETIHHKDFMHDVGTISLAKYKSMAHFFSGLTGRGKEAQVVLHIDTRKLDPTAMKFRNLINTPDGELLYGKNIPVSAIMKAETVYTSCR